MASSDQRTSRSSSLSQQTSSKLLSAITSPAKVVEIVEDHKSSLSVAEWACKMIAGFTGNAIKTRNTEAMVQLLDDGICECLVTTMNTHSVNSAEVAITGCKALSDLSWTSRELREFLGEIGACECVIFVLSMHIGNPEVAEFGTSTVINLSKDISNSFRLAEAGACDIIVQTGNFGFNIRHPKAAIVAANVCHCIYNLCEARNQRKLSESGGCELVSALLKIHLEAYEVVVAASRAICGLASLTAEHREIIGRVGGCALIVQSLQIYKANPAPPTPPPPQSPSQQSRSNIPPPSPDRSSASLSSLSLSSLNSPATPSGPAQESLRYLSIIENCCEAIMHLALSPNNTERLQQAGGCEALVKALDTHLLEREFGAEICCGAMVNLVTYGLSAPTNILRLRQAGAILLMQRVQSSSRASQRAREHAVLLTALMTETESGGSANPTNGGAGSSGNASSRFKSTGGIMVGVVLGSEPRHGTVPLQAEVREYTGSTAGSTSRKKSLTTVSSVGMSTSSASLGGSERDEGPSKPFARRGSGSLDQQPIFERSSSSYGGERDVYEI
jgi:hypothetical protein